MKIAKTSLVFFLFLGWSTLTFSQTAENILNKYIALSGGQSYWEQIQSMKITGTAKALSQGMELPFERIMDNHGKQIVTLKINEMNYVSIANDGKKVWGSSPTMEPELKGKDETINTKNLVNDFPFPGFKWKERGYKLAYEGKAIVDSIETFKVKMTKLPQMVNGSLQENVAYLYFDTQRYLPILVENQLLSGPAKGKIQKSYLKDYRAVDGYLYPFITEMYYDDNTQPFQIIETLQVEWNPQIEEVIYKMPNG